MREVTGADECDAFSRRPERQMLEIEVAARGARMLGMDVQVRVKTHGDVTLSEKRACVVCSGDDNVR
jgi:hypothetical protein